MAEAARRMSGELEQTKLRAARLGRALACRHGGASAPETERVHWSLKELDTDGLRALVQRRLWKRGSDCAPAFAPEGGTLPAIFLGSAGRDLPAAGPGR